MIRLYCIGVETVESCSLDEEERRKLIEETDAAIIVPFGNIPIGMVFDAPLVHDGIGAKTPAKMKCVAHELGGKIAVCVDWTN